MKRISVYVKGDRNSASYYRIYQYLDKLDEVKCIYRMQMSAKVYREWMPISGKPIYIKAIVYIYIYFRVLFNLLKDWINVPDVIVLHRTFIGRYMPTVFRVLIKNIVSRGTKLIWDYDDQIVVNGEVTQFVFNYFTKLATHVVVTHDYLKSLLPFAYQYKAIILPTTDGDMYQLFVSSDVNAKRLSSLHKRVVLVWVATSVNMLFLEKIIPKLDEAARLLKEKDGRILVIKVICNASLFSKCKYLIVENVYWTREKAIQGMMESHIGIMPLMNNEFTRGKGGFKLVQYLSIGLPCIGTDVGFNSSVITQECGCLITEENDWISAILRLSNLILWGSYSECAYQQWNLHFSYERNMFVWKGLINSEINKY